MSSGTTNELWGGVWGTASDNVFAVGENGSADYWSKSDFGILLTMRTLIDAATMNAMKVSPYWKAGYHDPFKDKAVAPFPASQ